MPITLGELRAQGVGVFCWCNRCGHHATLQAAMLCVQLGPGCPVPGAALRMRCTSCGARDIATRPAWPSRGPITRHH